MLYRLVGRNGDSVDSLRRLISVTPAEKGELRDWAASSSPRVAVGIEHMLRFRNAVLAEFDRLLKTAPRSNVTRSILRNSMQK